MVDAVDSFLKNAVDLYIQAIKYCRISTSQIPTPVGPGIRQIRRESGKSGRHRRIPEIPCQIPARLAGISPKRPGSWTDQDTGRIRPGSGQNGRTPSIWPDSTVLAESPAVFCQIPATLPEFVSAKY